MSRMFVESRFFTALVKGGQITDEMLVALQGDIERGCGVTVSGTAGLKKVRCAAPGVGKSGGWRVVFADYPMVGRTALLMAFSKTAKSDLSPAEKAALRQVKRVLDRTIGE